MLKHKKKLKKLHRHIDKKIVFRARLYAIIFIIMLLFLLRDIFQGIISPQFFFAGLSLGVTLGVLASRMFQLSWDKDNKRIIARLDSFGIVILVFYILFSFFRNDLITFFVHGPMVGAISLAVLTGSFFGQLLGMRNGIKGILQAEGIIA